MEGWSILQNKGWETSSKYSPRQGFLEEFDSLFKGCISITIVLRIVDSDKEPAMGLIYEAIDPAKEDIQVGYNNKRKM
jgi:hypothetical protein